MKKILILVWCWIFTFFCYFANTGLAQGYPERFDVIIDIGHGGVDGGTSAYGVLEKELNLQIGKRLYERLISQGYNVGMTRVRDYALSDDNRQPIRSRHLRDLTQRKLIADALDPKVFISLHMNWSGHHRTRGPLVIYQANQKSYSLAHLLQQHLNTLYGIEKKPSRGRTYFLMKHLQMPSVIVELGYLSNAQDFTMVRDNKFQQQLADTIAHAVGEYFLLYPVE
ncbi:N-acetylmuramoyl-L-alanine amidase [Ammoniphilus sp. CFH 90114]|uniref:N-acetylmuramoyl-L-alanine amidase family protein n=1 Tax=Ammoniphilus sp. CFH 90114 TaxID=2493665 RepID=UPI0013E98B70|nr:N-acetylmuramoyl-L-alanine amidase [Ammoniphilus sp. CFH 90114]